MSDGKLLSLAMWVPILDGDTHGCAMYERHYSSRKSIDRRRRLNTKLFIGPGEKLVLATPCRRALFAWRKERYRKDGQTGIECCIFRNEGAGLASTLIREADRIADEKWPGQRHFTFIDTRFVAGDPPGNCFRHAGWKLCAEKTGKGLLILERAAND